MVGENLVNTFKQVEDEVIAVGLSTGKEVVMSLIPPILQPGH